MPTAEPSQTGLPATCGIAFKEWAGVCDALARGTQTLLLRKGGIDEGPGGFRPEHSVFWLYPTRVHQAEQGLATGPPARASSISVDTVVLSAMARVVLVAHLDRPEQLDRLEGFHVWTAETVWKRYHYRRPGLWVLGVRLFVHPEGWSVPITPDQAGCKSWVPIDPPLSTERVVPVLDQVAFEARMDRLAHLLELTGRRGGP